MRESSEGSKIVSHKLFNPRTKAMVNSSEKTLPKETCMSEKLSWEHHGWIVFMNKKDFFITSHGSVQTMGSSPRAMSLPCLGFDPCVTMKQVSL